MQTLEQKRAGQRLAMKRARARDPEGDKKYMRDWRLANKDKVAAIRKRYWQSHKTEVKEYNDEWRRRKRAIAKLLTEKTKKGVRAPAVGTRLLAMITAEVPNTLPVDVRDDVIGEMCMAVLERKVAADDLKSAVRSFIAAHYKMFDQHKNRSLDELLPGTDNVRLIDTIEADTAHF